MHVDATPPRTEAVLTGPSFTAAAGDAGSVGGPLFVSSETLVGLAAQDPMSREVASGVSRTLFGVDAEPHRLFVSSFPLVQEGPRQVRFVSLDNVENPEPPKLLAVSVDTTPPITYYIRQDSNTDSFIGASGIFVASHTVVVLTPRDPVSRQTAAGVSETRLSVDGGPRQAYQGEVRLTLAEGLHTLGFRSLDRVGNEEEPRTLAVAMDQTPPTTSLVVGAPKFAAFGLETATPETPIALSAADPQAAGVSAGVARTRYKVDGGAQQEYVTAFRLPEGTHAIEFWSEDRVGNLENARTAKVAVARMGLAALTGARSVSLAGSVLVSGNVESGGAVQLGGNALIDGNASGSRVTTQGSARVSGAITNDFTLHGEPIDLALVQALAEAGQTNDRIPAGFLSGGGLIVDGGRTLTLPEGFYVLESLEVRGKGQVEVQGPASLLVRGPIVVEGGGAVNAAGQARDLVVVSMGEAPVRLSGGALWAGILYAPRALLDLSGDSRAAGHLFAAVAKGAGNAGVEGGERLSASGRASGAKAAEAAAPPEAFTIKEHYAYPNPARRGEGTTFRVYAPGGEELEVRVHDVLGYVVHQGRSRGAKLVGDRNGPGTAYALEHWWDARRVPAGIYLYVVTVTKAGQAPVKASGRIVVKP
jgi:hypothetical protein